MYEQYRVLKVFPGILFFRSGLLKKQLSIYLHRRQHDGSICVRQTRRDPFTDTLSLLLITGDVVCERVEDENLSPLRALVERREKFVDRRGVHLKVLTRCRCRIRDLCECGHCVSDNLNNCTKLLLIHHEVLTRRGCRIRDLCESGH